MSFFGSFRVARTENMAFHMTCGPDKGKYTNGRQTETDRNEEGGRRDG
jgi:hypothetical protein